MTAFVFETTVLVFVLAVCAAAAEHLPDSWVDAFVEWLR